MQEVNEEEEDQGEAGDEESMCEAYGIQIGKLKAQGRAADSRSLLC